MKYKRVQINITEDQNDKLEQLKLARGGSKSLYVRRALDYYFDDMSELEVMLEASDLFKKAQPKQKVT